MGSRSRGFFEEANRMGGLVAKMRLASVAQLTSTEAATVEDSPELIARLEQAMARLRQEFPDSSSGANEAQPGVIALSRSGAEETRALRRHISTYVELMTQRSLFAGDVNATVRRVNEAACSAIDVDRVSVWFLEDKPKRIICADLFERSVGRHSSGVILFEADFVPYFTALQTERTIAAHDAHRDPRTSCFSTSYLAPLSISSMLDVPIWANGRMVGVVCHEHVGPGRTWNSDEEAFAYLMSSFVALALEQRARK
ncbi:MAG: GAF domain-containing protein [Polyangiaceae bacterium]|nr:GAF domain-containing protein [Polyangiaceae bacterium]